MEALAVLVDAAAAVERVEVDERERVVDERLLDVKVDLRVGRERGRVVHLEHERPELAVEHDVEAEQLEAARAGRVREARAVVVLERALARDQRLDRTILDRRPQRVHVVPERRDVLHDRRDAPAHPTEPNRSCHVTRYMYSINKYIIYLFIYKYEYVFNYTRVQKTMKRRCRKPIPLRAGELVVHITVAILLHCTQKRRRRTCEKRRGGEERTGASSSSSGWRCHTGVIGQMHERVVLRTSVDRERTVELPIEETSIA